YVEVIYEEKVEIIKKNISVVIGQYTKESIPVFQRIGKANNSEICWVNHDQPLDYTLDLKGYYQKNNARTVVEVIKALNSLKSKYNIKDNIIKNGFRNVIANTEYFR